MEIAVSVGGERFVVFREDEMGGRRSAGGKAFALAAVFGLEINPVDVVGVFHRMRDGSGVDGDAVAALGDDGQMFFGRAAGGVDVEFLHGLAAAVERHAGVVDHADEVFAFCTDVEFAFLHGIVSFVFECVVLFYSVP